ncbi:MAG: c-type cytochrome [Halioglobus sp.]
MRLSRYLVIILAVVFITACKVRIVVPEEGSVASESGAYVCPAGATCTIDVVDIFFNETFVAKPKSGYKFTNWKKRKGALCKGKKPKPCTLLTDFYAEYPALMALLESDTVFYLEPNFERVTSGVSVEIKDKYDRSCAVCHEPGTSGAPKSGDADAWELRMARGMDALVQSVNRGLNAMPPKGMCFDCSDQDFTALIEYMAFSDFE